MAKKRSSTRAKKPAKARPESPVEDAASEDYISGSDHEDAASLHSDALDEWESDHAAKAKTHNKRRRVASSPTKGAQTRSKSEKRSPAKKKRKVADEENDAESDVGLKEGQQVVGRVVEAPKTGWAPEGQVSQHTLDFLMHMQDPACNDRVWFKLHEPIYRRCEKEFKDFIEAFIAMLTEVDTQIPPLPAKDVIHRVYRDIRFSNDKTPYKTGFSASFSRSGKKGIFAFCEPYVSVVPVGGSALPASLHGIRMIKPGDESVLAAGAWCPAKNELNMIRNHIKHSSDRFREVISEPEFVAHFGEPHPHPEGKRRSIFGRDDELKTAPKGVDKNHKDIDLLKCRSLAVTHTFTDEQVLSGTFIQELENVARVLRPFIHYLNDMMTLPVESDSSDGEAPE